jgi:hypothetical protein
MRNFHTLPEGTKSQHLESIVHCSVYKVSGMKVIARRVKRLLPVPNELTVYKTTRLHHDFCRRGVPVGSIILRFRVSQSMGPPLRASRSRRSL